MNPTNVCKDNNVRKLRHHLAKRALIEDIVFISVMVLFTIIIGWGYYESF